MLSVIKELQTEIELTAIAPPIGPLADSLEELGVTRVDFSPRKNERLKRSQAEIFQQIASALESIQPDMLHANSLAMARLTGKWKHEFQLPCAGHLRDIIKLSKAAIHDLNGNDGLVAVSSATKNFHVEQGLDSSKTHVIYNGVDLEMFQPRPAQKKLLTELGIPKDAVLALSVGQICLRKGHDVLAKAAINAMKNVPNLHLLVAGERYSSKPESIAFEEDFENSFTDAGFRSRLHLLGYRNDIAEMMNEVNFLIHTAKQEPLGRVLLEAAASGLPIVATYVGGTREILPNTYGPVPKGMPSLLGAEMANQAISFIDRTSQRTAMRKQAVEKFDVKTAAANLKKFWESIIA